VWTIAVSTNFDRNGTLALFIGIAGGGVWRSTDFTSATPTWTPLTSHLPASFPLTRQVGLQNIGTIGIDPNHPWIIYAGTGDPADRGPNIYGQGMLKSIDGGNTWQLLTVGTSAFAPGFSRILVDPTDLSGNTVFCTGAFGPSSPLRGIFKSSTGGSTWTNIQNGMPNGVAVADLEYAIDGGKLTLFAGVTDVTGTNPAANGIWQSVDGGASWALMAMGPLTDLGTGKILPQSAIGLTNLAIDHTPGTAHGAFAAVSTGNSLMNVFKLIGGNWVPTGNGLRAINTTSAQAIGISPGGSVYVGGVNDSRQQGLFQSTNGGTSWVSVDVGSNGVRPHTDQHAWAFFGALVFNGNDGGIYRFDPLPNGAAGPGGWNSLNTSSLQTLLSQGVGMHPSYPSVMLEGSQDNGVALRTRGSWKYVTGSDAARCRFDPFDGRFAFQTGPSDFSFFGRSDDGGQTWNDKSVPGTPSVPDYARFAFHPTQAGRIAVGLDRVFESRDRGDNWTAISGPRAGAGTFVSSIAYGGGDILYAAWGGRLFKTTNDGGDASDGNWVELNAGNNWRGSIISIMVDPHNLQRVYLATDGGAIWRSLDTGSDWADITYDFPSPPLSVSALALRSDTATARPTLFAASSVGVWAASDAAGALSWSRLGSDLPDVAVTDLQFNQTNKYLVAGTYGRGLFAAYLHFLTDVGLGATSLNNVVFSFARDLDGRICVNQAEYRRAFSGWFEVQGGGLTDAAPAATAVRQSVFVFVKGLNNRLYLNQAEFGHAFSGWFEVQGNGLTDAAPAAATTGNHVFVFVKGLDNHIYLNQADFGHAFGNWFEVQGNGLTDAAPTAAAIRQTVFVAVKGLNNRIYLNQADLGHAFGSWFEVQGNGLTDRAPAAAALNDTLFLVVKGLDGRIYVNQAQFGHAFSGWFELQGGGLTDTAPAATAIGNSLFVFVKGLDGRVYLNQAEFGHPFSGWFEVGGGI
jgi:hypothetical protein